MRDLISNWQFSKCASGSLPRLPKSRDQSHNQHFEVTLSHSWKSYILNTFLSWLVPFPGTRSRAQCTSKVKHCLNVPDLSDTWESYEARHRLCAASTRCDSHAASLDPSAQGNGVDSKRKNLLFPSSSVDLMSEQSDTLIGRSDPSALDLFNL
nr:hypothetical protein CFP56_65213 [Quercus suber]